MGSEIFSNDFYKKLYLRSLSIAQVLVIFILSLLPYSLHSQIQTELNPNIILIGDTASLKITVTYDARQKVILPQIGDSLNSFLEVSNVKIDSMKVGNNANYIQTITLTSFDIGDFLVNSLPVVIEGDTLLTSSKRLEVRDLEVDADLDKMYPIKPIIPQEITWWEKNKKYLAYWVVGILLAIIIIVLIWLYLKAAKKNKYVSKPLLPPYEEALENLKKLDKENYLSKQNYNQFYTDLSFIIRRYFSRRFDFPAMALLSGDLPAYMKNKELLTESEAEQLSAFLKDSDLAKFGRTIPAEEKHTYYRNWIEEIIQKTRPILEEDIPQHMQDEVEQEKLRKLDNR